jgi:hypothetical protein
MSPPKDPVKREEWCVNHSKMMTGSGNPMYGKRHSDETRGKISSGTLGKTLGRKQKPRSEEHCRKLSESHRGKILSDETRKKIGNALRGKPFTEIHRKKIGESNRGKIRSNETRRLLSAINIRENLSKETLQRRSEAHRGKTLSEEHRRKIGNAARGTHRSNETRQKISESRCGEKHPLYGKHPTYETRMKISEAGVGGFCIQNIIYGDPKYCEFWCPDLWHRIDKAQNYQSILSGKTKEDNGGRALSRHHVYWQKKACCEWDEDVGGYYAWIETGTKKHPNKVKYYIKGDPNKFVLLTMSEHQMIKMDKIRWIELFEDLIKTKLSGVCYLPK